jgi:hypothetical protein
MTTYADLDGVIDAWVKATGSTLFTEWAGVPARFFHLSGDPPFECFQLSVRLTESGQIGVAARAIDTNDDTEEELDREWEVTAAELDSMLRLAVATVEGWKARERRRPDPPSPW